MWLYWGMWTGTGRGGDRGVAGGGGEPRQDWKDNGKTVSEVMEQLGSYRSTGRQDGSGVWSWAEWPEEAA